MPTNIELKPQSHSDKNAFAFNQNKIALRERSGTLARAICERNAHNQRMRLMWSEEHCALEIVRESFCYEYSFSHEHQDEKPQQLLATLLLEQVNEFVKQNMDQSFFEITHKVKRTQSVNVEIISDLSCMDW